MQVLSRLSEAIRTNYQALSVAQKRIADFLLENTNEVAFLTVDRLAAKIGVSPSTITRFAIEMGFSGYPELQEVAQGSVRQQLAVAEGPAVALDLYAASFACDIKTIEAACRLNPPEVLDRAVTMLLEARHVYVAGMRGSLSLADYLAFHLNRSLGTASLMIPDGGRLPEQIVGLNPEDLVVAIAFPAYTRSTVEATRYAREAGVTVLALTDGPRSPLAQLCDLMLPIPCDSSPIYDPNPAAMAVENALIAGIAARQPERVRRQLERVNEELARRNVTM